MPHEPFHAPTYALYGEAGVWPDVDLLHCETIAARSRLHDFRIAPHRHERMLQLLYLAAGTGTVAFDGNGDALRPPCVVVMPARVVHSYSFSDDVDGLVLTLHEQQVGAVLQACPEAMGSLGEPRVIPLAGEPGTASLVTASLSAVAAEFAGHAAGRTAMMQAHLAIAWVALHRARLARPPSPAIASPPGARRVARFCDMIERDFHSRRSVEEYAGRLGVTPTHLRRLCRAHLDQTPLEILNQRAVLEAKRLLVFSTLSVKQIAEAVGFSDHAYFSRFFLREMGLAPTAFRAMRQTTWPREPALSSPPRRADTHPATGPKAV